MVSIRRWMQIPDVETAPRGKGSERLYLECVVVEMEDGAAVTIELKSREPIGVLCEAFRMFVGAGFLPPEKDLRLIAATLGMPEEAVQTEWREYLMYCEAHWLNETGRWKELGDKNFSFETEFLTIGDPPPGQEGINAS